MHLLLNGVLQTCYYCFYHIIWRIFHILHHSALSFNNIHPLIHSWLHSDRPNVSFCHDRWVTILFLGVIPSNNIKMSRLLLLCGATFGDKKKYH